MGVHVTSYPETLEPGAQAKTKPLGVYRALASFPALITGLVLILTSLPYLYGYLRTPSTKTFMGIMLDVPDTTQYWAWMRAMGHSWLISNPLTSEANDPAFFNLLWGLLGHFQALSGLEAAWVYQLFRVAAIIFFGWISWDFCRFIFARPLAQRTTYVLILLGSGWGWLPVAIKQFTGTLSNPLAVFIAEPNGFYSALAFPHLIFSAALIMAIFRLIITAGETRKYGGIWLAAGVALVLGLEHTYDLLIVYGVLGAYWLWRVGRYRKVDWFWVKLGLIIGVVSAFPSLYSAYLTMGNPTWKGVLAQYGNGLVYTPDPINLLILMGPLLLLALLGLRSAPPPTLRKIPSAQARVLPERLEFIKVWFVVGCFLIYIPTDFQIKMLNGWQVPIFTLAVAALLGPVRGILGSLTWRHNRLSWNRHFELALCLLTILVALPTTLYLFSWRLVDLNRTEAPYYLQKDELAALNWLENPPEGPGVVLASETLGQYVAPFSGQRPFLAHWAMTLDYYKKRDLTAEVLNPNTSPERRAAILSQYHIRYLLYGSAEKQHTPELAGPGLHKVFSSPQADIYIFEQSPNPGGQLENRD
jgi:hypothetical protein